MERFMPIWILIIALLSVAATALLASILARVNAPPRREKGSDGGGGDTGALAAGSSDRGDRTDNDGTGDGGSDGGGD